VIDLPSWQECSVPVHEATWMIAAQLHCGMIEAYGRLQIRAHGAGMTPDDFAVDVLDGLVIFEP